MNSKQRAKAFEDAVLEWHRWLHGKPGHRAALRRAGTLAGVRAAWAGSPSAHLHIELKKVRMKPSRDQVAIVAGLLAFLNPERPSPDDPSETNGSGDEKEPEQKRPRVPGSARALGRFLAMGGRKSGLMELRFRRLHAVENGDREELFLRLGRVVRAYRREHIEQGLRPLDVAYTAYYWGDRIREDLALGYYSAVLRIEGPEDTETPASTTSP